MKVTLEYNLPADHFEYNRVMMAEEMAEAIDAAYYALRNHLKHGEPDKDRDTLEKIQEILCDAYWKIAE